MPTPRQKANRVHSTKKDTADTMVPAQLLLWHGRLYFTSKEVGAYPRMVQLALLSQARVLEPAAFHDDGVCFERLEARTHWCLRQWFRSAYPKGYDGDWTQARCRTKAPRSNGDDTAASSSTSSVASTPVPSSPSSSASTVVQKAAFAATGSVEVAASSPVVGMKRSRPCASDGVGQEGKVTRENDDTAISWDGLCPSTDPQGLLVVPATASPLPAKASTPPVLPFGEGGRFSATVSLGGHVTVSMVAPGAESTTSVGWNWDSEDLDWGVLDELMKAEEDDVTHGVLATADWAGSPFYTPASSLTAHEGCKAEALSKHSVGVVLPHASRPPGAGGDLKQEFVNGEPPSLLPPTATVPTPSIRGLENVRGGGVSPTHARPSRTQAVDRPLHAAMTNTSGSAARLCPTARFAAVHGPTACSSSKSSRKTVGKSAGKNKKPATLVPASAPAGEDVPVRSSRRHATQKWLETYKPLCMANLPARYTISLESLGLDEQLPRMRIRADVDVPCGGIGKGEMRKARAYLTEIHARFPPHGPTGSDFMSFFKFLPHKASASKTTCRMTMDALHWSSSNPSAAPGAVMRTLLCAHVPAPGTPDRQKLLKALGCDADTRLHKLNGADLTRFLERLYTVIPELACIPA